MTHAKLVILFVLFLSYFAKAQDACDTIYTCYIYAKNNNIDKVLGKVVEVNQKYVKYHIGGKSYWDSFLYQININKVLCIKYSNGKVDSFKVNINAYKDRYNGKVDFGVNIYTGYKMDTNNYFHIGIIPYQLLTRSSGIYARYDFKRLAIEYRPTYTYALNLEPGEMWVGIYYDNFYFKGINCLVLK